MSIKILPCSSIRSSIANLIRSLDEEGASCYVTLHGKAKAVLLGIDKFNHLMDLLEDSLDERDEELAKRVQEARRNKARGHGILAKKYFQSND